MVTNRRKWTDKQRLDFLINHKFIVHRLLDTDLYMVQEGDGYPVTGEEYETALEALDSVMDRAASDPLEGHSSWCHAVQPGDRECNCHKIHGFETAEALQQAVEIESIVKRKDKCL